MAKEIVDTVGGIISEFPLGTAPEMGNFPVRKRSVSGMSLGTLVVASGLEGGSMITAKSALDQNREVFVVPHPLGHPNAIGCNSLIKRGMGKLIQNVEDILIEIDIHIQEQKVESDSAESSRSSQNKWESMELDKLSISICKVLAEQSLHIDHLAERLKLETHKLMQKLLELEMQGAIRQTAGKNFELL